MIPIRFQNGTFIISYPPYGYDNVDGEMVIEGSADLVVSLDSCVLVIDFKTDRAFLPDIHKEQVMKYIEAIGGLYGKECYGMLLYARSMESGPVWDRNGDVRELSELLSSL